VDIYLHTFGVERLLTTHVSHAPGEVTDCTKFHSDGQTTARAGIPARPEIPTLLLPTTVLTSLTSRRLHDLGMRTPSRKKKKQGCDVTDKSISANFNLPQICSIYLTSYRPPQLCTVGFVKQRPGIWKAMLCNSSVSWQLRRAKDSW